MYVAALYECMASEKTPAYLSSANFHSKKYMGHVRLKAKERSSEAWETVAKFCTYNRNIMYVNFMVR